MTRPSRFARQPNIKAEKVAIQARLDADKKKADAEANSDEAKVGAVYFGSMRAAALVLAAGCGLALSACSTVSVQTDPDQVAK